MKKTKETNQANKLYYGDNLDVLRKYIKSESVDLCYIDPPFNSKRNYNQIYLNQGKTDKAEAQAFVDTWEWDNSAIKGYKEITENGQNRFSEKTIFLIEGLAKVLGKGGLLAYLIHITLRVVEIHRVLKPTGSFYLHCDPTASHYLKLVLDSVFCTNSGDFRNEIIWCYTAPTNTRDNFPKKHDVIFRYTKTNEWTFNYEDISIPYSQETVARTGRGSGNQGLYKNINPEEKHANRLKPKGKIPEDWWIISRLQGNSIERLGYPTQKPEALLERIIKASSNKGDVILDAYCGCGTTISVAEKLQRKWIGIDITYQSIGLILHRLEKSFGKKINDTIELNGVPKDFESAEALANKKDDKTRKEFEKWAVLFYSNNRAMINEKKGGDGGIDGIALIQERDKKNDIVNKKIIFSVKSDKILVPAYINQLKGKMHDEDVVMGVFLCLYKPTGGMIKEAKEMGIYKNNLFNMEYPKLQIVTVKEMFDLSLRLNIPVLDVIKDAEQKEDNKNQNKLEL